MPALHCTRKTKNRRRRRRSWWWWGPSVPFLFLIPLIRHTHTRHTFFCLLLEKRRSIQQVFKTTRAVDCNSLLLCWWCWWCVCHYDNEMTRRKKERGSCGGAVQCHTSLIHSERLAKEKKKKKKKRNCWSYHQWQWPSFEGQRRRRRRRWMALKKGRLYTPTAAAAAAARSKQDKQQSAAGGVAQS